MLIKVKWEEPLLFPSFPKSKIQSQTSNLTFKKRPKTCLIVWQTCLLSINQVRSMPLHLMPSKINLRLFSQQFQISINWNNFLRFKMRIKSSLNQRKKLNKISRILLLIWIREINKLEIKLERFQMQLRLCPTKTILTQWASFLSTERPVYFQKVYVIFANI